jgi:hypothetical protein
MTRVIGVGLAATLVGALSGFVQVTADSAAARSLRFIDPAALSVAQPGATAAAGGPMIDLLILYTVGARDAVGGTLSIKDIAALATSYVNTVFTDSGVVANVRLVGAEELAPFPEQPSNSIAMLGNLTNWPAAKARRDALGADLVHLFVLTNQPSPIDPDLFSCWTAWPMTARDVGPAFERLAYSLSDPRCASLALLRALASNMGSNANSGQGAFPFSFGFIDPQLRFRTVEMSRADVSHLCPPNQCGLINNFSNPGVFVPPGAPTGTAQRNNALSLTNVAPVVAAFRQATLLPPPPPTNLTAEVDGPDVVLKWVGSQGATSYVVEAGTFQGGTNIANADVGNVTTLSATGADGIYYVRVRAKKDGVTSDPSNEVEVRIARSCEDKPPFAPGSLTVELGPVLFGQRSVTLRWTAPACATSYRIVVTAVPGGVQTFETTALGGQGTIVGGRFYTIEVYALNQHGASLFPATKTIEPF